MSGPNSIEGDQRGTVNKRLLIRLETQPGKEGDVASFLEQGLPIVQDEPATIAWFGVRMGPSSYGIIDYFPDETGRQAHLTGRVAQATTQRASELFASPPAIEQLDVLASKLPT